MALYVYGTTLICVNILPFIFYNFCNSLYVYSTVVASWRWLWFAAETSRSLKANCAVSLEFEFCCKHPLPSACSESWLNKCNGLMSPEKRSKVWCIDSVPDSVYYQIARIVFSKSVLCHVQNVTVNTVWGNHSFWIWYSYAALLLVVWAVFGTFCAVFVEHNNSHRPVQGCCISIIRFSSILCFFLLSAHCWRGGASWPVLKMTAEFFTPGCFNLKIITCGSKQRRYEPQLWYCICNWDVHIFVPYYIAGILIPVCLDIRVWPG